MIRELLEKFRRPAGFRGGSSPAADPPSFEPLENRTLLSSALLGIPVDYPVLFFDSGGTMHYDAANQTLQLTGSPYFTQLNDVTPPGAADGNLTLNIRIGNDGTLLGGVPGDDLVVQGNIDVDGNGSIDYSGVLLTGEIAQYGALDSGATDQYDFRFTATGGALVAAGFFAGKDIGMQTNSLNSTFEDNFNVDFGGSSEGWLGPTAPLAPLASIHIEKLVKDMGSPEGFTLGFWKQCQHFQYWTGYQTTDRYNQVFGVNVPSNPTLLQALGTGGGGMNALLRQSVAALLNAANSNVSFFYVDGQVKAMVQQAFATGQFETYKNMFEAQNQLEGNISKGPAPGFGLDADTAPGLSVGLGNLVQYTYVVTNPGGTSLANVSVIDDNGTPTNTADDFVPYPVLMSGFNVGDLNRNGKLDPGEQWLYTARQIAKYATQVVNTATVVATPVNSDGVRIGSDVTDQDPAYYTVVSPTGCGGHYEKPSYSPPTYGHQSTWKWGGEQAQWKWSWNWSGKNGWWNS